MTTSINTKSLYILAIFFLLSTVIIALGYSGYAWINEFRSQQISPIETQPLTAIGYVDKLSLDLANKRITVSGWALSNAGVARVELVLNGKHRIPLTIGQARPDVTQAYPDFPNSAKAGFQGTVDSFKLPDAIQTLELVITDNHGRTTILARRKLPASNTKNIWSSLLKSREFKRDDIFYFVMATSNIAGGGAEDIDSIFRPYESDTVKVGIRVPLLYLRTTKGKAGDYAFDADFPPSRKCGTRTIAEDNLHGVIDFAIKHRLPVLFTLNGGIWADAACDAPEWDINDVLEQNTANCQWNEKDQVMADDYLKNLSGSMASPELGRSLTLNIYAASYRNYKKRNLQQAVSIIREFAARHPALFIGVNADPDVYQNPFFEGRQWYDYNPGTLRQFREWLRGSGPYSERTVKGIPDLSRYRKEKPLTLAEVNALSGHQLSLFTPMAPPIFGVMAPLKAADFGARTGVKNGRFLRLLQL